MSGERNASPQPVDSQQRKPELPLLGSRTRMSVTETRSHHLEAIELERRKYPAPASEHHIPAWESTTIGGREPGTVADDSHSESHA
jgi:hypothetical protein